MKKLMMALAVTFTGASVMAASCSWQVDCYDLGTDVSGWNIYAVSGGGAGSLANYLTSGNYASAADFFTALNAATLQTEVSDMQLDGDAYAEGTNPGLAKTGDSIAYLLVESTAEGAGVIWTADISTDGYTFEGSDTPNTLRVWDSDFTNSGVVKYGTGPGPDPVPEPTSGLLLLLGVAGLALRRRRA